MAINDYQCIHCRLAIEHCICSMLPTASVKGLYTLLQHRNERRKAHNTGHWLNKVNVIAEYHLWHRTMPKLDMSNTWLIYPSEDSTLIPDTPPEVFYSNEPPKLMLLDGTWQESKKMVRQSPWLRDAPSWRMPNGLRSQFHLRRNQTESGLSTFETFIYLERWLAGNVCAYEELFQLWVDRFLKSQNRQP